MTTPPDSMDPTPEVPPPLEADLPAYQQGKRARLDPLDPNSTTSTTASPPMEAPNFYRADEELEELDDAIDRDLDEERFERRPTRPEGPSRRSAGDPSVATAAAGLFSLAATIIAFALNATIGRRSGAYLMAEEEAEAIGQPLGRIMARRAPIGDADVTDVSDGIQAGVATAAYAARATMEHFGAPLAEPGTPDAGAPA